MLGKGTTMSTRSIVVISAGLSQPSSTRLLADRLADATVTELAARGITATVEHVELRDVAHEVVNMTLSGFASGPLKDVLEKVTAADGVIAVTPIFSASYSGLFKSFVDILDKDALVGRPVLVGATGGTGRHSLALEYALRPLFAYLRADVAGTAVFAATDDWADGGGDDVNPLPAAHPPRRAASSPRWWPTGSRPHPWASTTRCRRSSSCSDDGQRLTSRDEQTRRPDALASGRRRSSVSVSAMFAYRPLLHIVRAAIPPSIGTMVTPIHGVLVSFRYRPIRATAQIVRRISHARRLGERSRYRVTGAS